MTGLGRFGRPDGWYDLFARGNDSAWDEGPRLADVAYPDVLVARAVSDGQALDLVLRPGAAGSRQPLHLERLRPHGRYRLEATGHDTETIEAAEEGTSTVHVDLHDRTEVRLTPLP